jgi:hypothetical protein
LGACKRHDIEFHAFGLVEPVGLNGVEQPADRAEFQNADPDLARGMRGQRETGAEERADKQC